MNAAEDRLSELMDAATCALDPPIESLLAGGERLGRARKRRRHIALASGAMAVVLLAGAGVAVGLRDTGPARGYSVAGHQTRPPQSLAPQPASPAQTPSPTGSSTFPAPHARKPGEVPIDATAAINILRELAAKNWQFGTPLPSTPGSLLNVDVDDGKGLAQITVNIAPAANSGMEPADCSRQHLGLPTFSASPTGPRWTGGASPPSSPDPAPFTVTPTSSECYITQMATTGDVAMTEVLVSPPSKAVVDRVIAYRADGIAIEITARNGDLKSIGAGVTRVWPPLDDNKWTFIALDPIWQLYVPAALAK
jgi:hypothetical protein